MRNGLCRMVTIAVALCVTVGLTSGCGKKAADVAQEKIAEQVVKKAIESSAAAQGKDAKVDVDLKKGGMTIKTAEGTMQTSAGDGVTLPANFPNDVLVYPGLKLKMVNTVTEGDGFNIMGTTSASPKEVATAYKKAATEKGWSEKMVIEQEEMQMLNYEKDKRTLNVSISKDSEGTLVTVTTAKES